MGTGTKFPGVEDRSTTVRISFYLDGKRHRRDLKIPPTPKNLAHASKLRARILYAIRMGTFEWADFFPEHEEQSTTSAVPCPTFDALADTYLDSADHLARSTLRGYRAKLRYYRPTFGAKPINTITHSMVLQAVADNNFKTVKTRNDSLTPLEAVFELALADGWITKNPVVAVKRPKRQKPEPDPLTTDEVTTVLNDLERREHPAVANYFTFAIFSGCRPSEINALTWDDIDFRKGLVRIDKARVYQQVKDTKTHERRDVELNDWSRAALEAQKAQTFLAGGEVFLNPETGFILHDEKSMRLIWNRCLKRLGIRHRVAYQCRHTFATMYLMANAAPMWVARQMGHANPAITLNTYARWLDRTDQSREVNKLASVMPKTG